MLSFITFIKKVRNALSASSNVDSAARFTPARRATRFNEPFDILAFLCCRLRTGVRNLGGGGGSETAYTGFLLFCFGSGLRSLLRVRRVVVG